LKYRRFYLYPKDRYYSGAWRNFGTTTNGVATKELLPLNYNFRASIGKVSKEKQQDIATNRKVEINLNIP